VRSTTGFGQHLAFGGPGFLPVPGDYDGDGETDTAIYEQSTDQSIDGGIPRLTSWMLQNTLSIDLRNFTQVLATLLRIRSSSWKGEGDTMGSNMPLNRLKLS
jgi:hypothetical protein